MKIQYSDDEVKELIREDVRERYGIKDVQVEKDVDFTAIFSIGNEEETTTYKVKACQNASFHGMDCLENNEEYGFFKNKNDVRPSSCTWIKKEIAEKLFGAFKFEYEGDLVS